MKISAITPYSQNQNYKINTKGKLSGDAQLMVEDICYNFIDKLKKTPNESTIKRAFFDQYVKRTKNMIENLKTIMLRFPQTAVLDFQASKQGFNRFYIHSPESSYKYIVGDIKPESKFKDIENLEKITDKLAKVNPYETNLKFKMFKHEFAKDSFAPEKDIILIEDALVGKEPKPDASMEDIKKFLELAKKEGLID